MMSLQTLNDAFELNYKAIMTLYSYAEVQKTVSSDILGDMNSLFTDSIIKQNDIAKLLNMVEKLSTITDRNITVSEEHAKLIKEVVKINELMCNCIKIRIDKDGDNNKILFKMVADEIDKINKQRRQEKFYYLCDFTMLVGAILALYLYK